MKTFISIIIAIAAYIIFGLIAWNIVCSNIDILSKTMVELADYKLYSYSAVTAILLCGLPHLSSSKIENEYYITVLIMIGVNLGIAIAVNHWESAWEIVSSILSILYNLVNIILITLTIYALLKETT